MSFSLSVHTENWPLREPFAFAGQHWTHADLLVVAIEAEGLVGTGEAYGVFYRGECASSMQEQVEDVADSISSGIERSRLLSLLPSGGARNAVDAALWDYEAKQCGRSVWELVRVACDPAQTVLTVGMKPQVAEMAAYARKHKQFSILKLKVAGDNPLDCVRAVREVRPDARILVDANQSWTFDQLMELEPAMHSLGVEMIEQPLPSGDDDELEAYRGSVRLCADESFQGMEDLQSLKRRYTMVSIKLDKVGGLTAGLNAVQAARDQGLGVTIGTMPGTSRSIAAAHVLAQFADFSDLDSPLLLRWDTFPSVSFVEGDKVAVGSGCWGTS